MVMVREKPNIEISETDQLIEEYKQKLVLVLQKEKDKVHETAVKETKAILAKAYKESASLTEKARLESMQVIEKANQQARLESDSLISQARQKADQIIREAEEAIKKAVLQRTQREVEAIFRNTREEAAVLIQQIKEDAEKEAAVLTRSAEEIKKQAILELMETRQKSWESVEKVRLDTLKDAQEIARKEADEIINRAQVQVQTDKEGWIIKAKIEAKQIAEKEAEQIINKANIEAQQIIETARLKAGTRMQESNHIILELQQKLMGIMANDESMTKPLGSQKSSSDFSPVVETKIINVAMVQQSKPETTSDKAPFETVAPVINHKQPNNPVISEKTTLNYKGSQRLNINFPAKMEQVYSLANQLVKTGCIRVTSMGGDVDDSLWLEIDISEPLPLIKILKELPLVENLTEDNKRKISLSLKSA